MKMLYIKHRSGKVMNNFAISAILAAKELGIDFTIANNMSMADKEHFVQVCKRYEIQMVHIDFDRNPLGKSNFLARKQLLDLMAKEKYDIVHCNTPSGGVVGRIAAAQAKIPKVIYMAHGFHFWKGAPLKNWLFYYPVERILARLTDRLITINREDYACAQRFHYKRGGSAAYVPGVGIVTKRFESNAEERTKMRKALGIKEEEIVLLSVGEINQNKNHKVVIKALAQIGRKDIRYVICGIGSLMEANQQLAESLGLRNQVMFAGYRTDIDKFYQAADVFVISSFREGLPVALLEAMSAGLPCVASRIRGNVDLLSDSRLLFEPRDVNGLCNALMEGIDKNIAEKEVKRNYQTLPRFSMEEAVKAIKQIYTDMINELSTIG
ncbi:MAG: glycosyltransferase family 4 protein [Clostridiaceae bacterium]|jgi:glycosyltransferase involved in cell wall biosynthesis|nr:glycosyltransferase family 4 protein [Clostridiaceae bacterium]